MCVCVGGGGILQSLDSQVVCIFIAHCGLVDPQVSGEIFLRTTFLAIEQRSIVGSWFDLNISADKCRSQRSLLNLKCPAELVR